MLDIHPIVLRAIAERLETIGKAYQTDADVRLSLEVMPEGTNIWVDYEVNIDWAVKSIEEVKEVLKKFAQRGIMIKTFQKSDTNPIWILQGLNSTIRLVPTWAREDVKGATCRLIQVGSETKTVPVYKLVCSGGEEKELNNDTTAS